MALTEQRILSQVTVLPESGTIQCQWADQILRDGEVISQKFHRKAYSSDQSDEFIAEVDGAPAYIAAIGWGG